MVTRIPPAETDQILVLLQVFTVLRRSEQSRRVFLANISHDLRTPLASLQAMIETLQEGALDDRPAAEDFLRRMDAEVGRLNRLVSEFLELTQIESGSSSRAVPHRYPVAVRKRRCTDGSPGPAARKRD